MNVQPHWRCERCDTPGHLAEQCWIHVQFPYNMDRWTQIGLLTAALTNLVAEQSLEHIEQAKALLKKLDGPPCSGPPTASGGLK